MKDLDIWGAAGWREAERLAALDRYEIMDTPSEAEFDDIARIAAQICGAPIALVSLLDDKRQWFKARLGLDATETPRDIAFCGHAIQQDDVFEVPDATRDDRFADNPLVTGELGLRFYAGAPVVTPDGLPLGTLCVLGQEPHALSDDQRDALRALARQVMTQLELRRTLAQQRAAEERHRLILESAVDYAIISMDLRGLVTSWNEGAHRLFGWAEEEMCGRHCDDFFTPEDRAAGVPEQEMGLALRSGRGTDERWHLRKDGSRFWANGEMMPLTDDADNPVGFIKILRDRTEQRNSRERLEASERRFQLALGAAGFIGSWEWDVQDDLVRTDAHFARVHSIAEEDAAAGLPLARFVASIHPDDSARVSVQIAKCVAGGADFAEEYRLRDAGGAVRWVFARGRCFSDEADRPTIFAGVAIEITDRKSIEDALRESETRTRLALDAAGLGAWESTPTLEEMKWDARTRELLGQAPDEALDYATSFLARVHPEDRPWVEADIGAALSGGGMLDCEYRTQRPDGDYRWIHARGRLIAIAGQPDRFVGTVRDISAQKSAEEHRALLSYELQHRIKNTLSVVQAIVSQSLRNVSTPAEARQAVGDRLVTLARAHDLLTQTSWSAAPIEALIGGAIAIIGPASERVHFGGPPLLLKARSALALSMALHELCTNAAKYGALSDDGGHVDVRWSLDDHDMVTIVWQEHGGPAVVTPTRKGFGSRLIETSLASDLGGRGVVEYLPGGVRWTLATKRGDIEDSDHRQG